MKEIKKKKKNIRKWVIENIDKALEDKIYKAILGKIKRHSCDVLREGNVEEYEKKSAKSFTKFIIKIIKEEKKELWEFIKKELKEYGIVDFSKEIFEAIKYLELRMKERN